MVIAPFTNTKWSVSNS